MKLDSTPSPELHRMSAAGVYTSVLATSSLYAFYWVWKQGRSEKTALDRRIKWWANLGVTSITLFFIVFFIALIWTISTRTAGEINFLPVWPFLCLIFLSFLSLCTCVALLTKKLDAITSHETSTSKMVLLTLAWYVSLPILQKRINEIHQNMT